jgi:hypothetical protein
MLLRHCSWCAAWLACLGMLVPALPVRAQAPTASPAKTEPISAKTLITDVALHDAGRLYGMVVDAQGLPMPRIDVTVSQAGNVVARAKTDALGQFSSGTLRGGVYQIAAGNGVTTLRVWEASAAPPAARSVALVVGSSTVVRGQRSFGSLVCSDALVLAAIIAAAIAIPIAISNSDNAEPSSS